MDAGVLVNGAVNKPDSDKRLTSKAGLRVVGAMTETCCQGCRRGYRQVHQHRLALVVPRDTIAPDHP
jgi:hypothetical protein